MSSLQVPSIDFVSISSAYQDKKVFSSKKIRTFAAKRLDLMQSIHLRITRNFDELQKENSASRNAILADIKEINSKCTEDFPNSTKVMQLRELKILFAPIKKGYLQFQFALNEENREKEEATKLFLSDCGAKKSQLLRNEQEEYEKNPLFQAFLEKIEQKFNESPRETIYFAYVRPTDSRYEKESWIQTFLKYLQAHLKNAGFSKVQLDIVSNRYGVNENEFMEGARTSGYVLLFGTESLLDEYSTGISAVCTQLNQIMRKREEDGKENVHRVFPILLSGEHRSAFPPEYERFSTIQDWRDHSYLHNFQQLFLELLGLPPEDYQSKLEKYWKDLSPLEAPSISDWYQQQREAIDTCSRNNDREGLLAIEVSRNLPLSTDEASPYPTLVERLKEHYTTRSTITILTFREKGKWELTLPVESLYTKLAMITEEERDERRDLSKLDDGRLPTHETIFKAKKEVTPEEIFKLTSGKRAVIYGSAGIGKTTFMTMLLYKWANGELFTEFQAVFCIRLRNLTKNFYPKGPVYHATDILHREYESLGLDRIDSDPQTTLLILDGWDELPPETREGGHLAQAFQELQEHYPNLLITSRPGAIDVDATEFEILGFSDIQIGVYIDRFFHTDASKAAGIRKFIRQNPLARSLAHIPINLSILCALYDEDDTLFNSETLLTNSALYDRIINQFYKIFLMRRGAEQNEIRTSPLLSLHPEVEPFTSCLEEIAYNASLKEEIYTNEREIAQIVYRNKVKIEDVRKLGLYRVENHQGSFIHLTFQEYFAALRISRFYESPETRPQALKIVKRIKFNAKFVRILSMVAGVLSQSGNQEALQWYFDDLHSEPRDLAEVYELTLLARCFEECDCPSNLSQYADFIERLKRLIDSLPPKHLITTLFRGNQKLLFHPDIVILFNELLNHKNSRKNLLSILNEVTSYSGMLPPEVFQKLEECLYEGVSQEDIVSILENIAEEAEVKALISLVADPKVAQNVRWSAVRVFEEIVSEGREIGKKGVEVLISLVADPKVDHYARWLAVLALGKIVLAGREIGKKGVEVLISLVADPKVDHYARRSAVLALGQIALAGGEIGEKSIDALISLVADPNVDHYVRRSAAFAIGEIASAGGWIGENGVEALVSLVADPNEDQNVLESAAKALVKIVSGGGEIGEEGAEALIALVADPRTGTNNRRVAAFVLQKIASIGGEMGEKVVEALISLVADPKGDQHVRMSAASALGEIASAGGEIGEKSVEALDFLLADPTVFQYVCESAVFLLVRMASAGEEIGEEGVEVLISLVADPKVVLDARSLTAKALGELVSAGGEIGEEGIEVLISLVADPKEDRDVRMSAAKALVKIVSAGGEIEEEGVEALISLVADPKLDQDVHSSAASALREIALAGGEIGEKSIEALISLVADPKVVLDVRSLTAKILVEIFSAGGEIGEEGVEALISLVVDRKLDQDVQSSVAFALGRIALAGGEIGEKSIDALISLVADPNVDHYVRRSAAFAIGEIASAGGWIGENGVEALISLVVDRKLGQDVRSSAAFVLGEIASAGGEIGEKGVEALISFVVDRKLYQDVQNSVAFALGEIASAGGEIGEKGVEALISLVADRKLGQVVRSSAVSALGKIASAGERIGEKGVEALISLVTDTKGDHYVRELVFRALGNISPNDVMKYYSENVEFLRLYCQVNQRGLIKEDKKWIITSQIK